MELWTLARGTTPLLIDVPHAGTYLPAEFGERLAPAARTLPDTDWHVDQLYAFAAARGATLMIASHSRYVVDLNRDPSGAALYPGADNTEICATRTFANEAIYRERRAPDSAEIAARIERYWRPYHESLAAEIAAIAARHGYAIVLDGHSIRSEVPRFFAGRLPDLNLGSADGRSADRSLERVAIEVLATAHGFTSVVNGRFKGGYITRHYGRPAANVHALQLEIAQACYMSENPPYAWDPARAQRLTAVLERLAAALLGWRPGS